jgi:hypothetical protein
VVEMRSAGCARNASTEMRGGKWPIHFRQDGEVPVGLVAGDNDGGHAIDGMAEEVESR